MKIINIHNEIVSWVFPKKEPKLFCIGLHKTGTTSLAKALSILGYTVKDYPTVRLLGTRFLWFKGSQINDYNCFTDATVIPLFKRLDKKFPNSKFILTTRDLDSWLLSCSKWPNFNRSNVTGKRKIYRERTLGAKNYDKKIFRQRYLDHHSDVYNYFKDRPNDLLILDISSNNKWELICNFLNKEKPDIDYPKSNEGSVKIKIKKIFEDLNLPKERFSEVHIHFIDKSEVSEKEVLEFVNCSKA